MRNIIILFFLTCAYSESFAQAGWVLQNSGTTNNLFGISTFDGVNAVAVGENGTVTTTDNEGRPSWNLQQNNIDSTLFSVTSISARILLAVGPKDSVYRSTDRGASWMGFHSWVRGQCWTFDSLRQVSAVDYDSSSKVCVAVGDQNEAIFSSDSGKSWEERLPFMLPGWHLSNFRCVSSYAGTILSGGISAGYPSQQHHNEVFTSTNQGDSWIQGDELGDITFLGCDSKALIFVGARGAIIHSKNKGLSWDPISSGTNVNLNSVKFAPDSLNGFIAGDGGLILMTRDGGYTWTREPCPTTQNLHNIALVDPFHVYICGDGGTILWTQAGGWSGVRSPNGEVSMDIQTYPNPISAKTTIQILLRGSRHIYLRVFNALGVEVATIANDTYDQGPHSFEWNAAEVPNGMYVCMLESEGQRIISQMIVAK